jgi:two-component system, OmpR family, response regulator
MKTKPSTLTGGGVLLIGSDPSLQQSVRAALEAENYEVLPAANLGEAREFLEVASIDVLVLDTRQESTSLRAFLTQLKAQRPHLRTIGIRGSEDEAAKPQLADVNVCMEKPLGPTRLVATVNNLLAELRSGGFRDQLVRRQTAPLFSSVPYGHWGLNE